MNIVMDGMQHQDINLIHPNSVGAIEAYPAGVRRVRSNTTGAVG
ncbi:MAG TPA: hypothetical protein VGP25_08105 [Gemmatimonadaceae bacterium]|nr:hypothetical protein [Gemmatimonadaceae bacterium]